MKFKTKMTILFLVIILVPICFSTIAFNAGIYDLSNEYGSPTSNLYNFIRINYNFVSGIKDVVSAPNSILKSNSLSYVPAGILKPN